MTYGIGDPVGPHSIEKKAVCFWERPPSVNYLRGKRSLGPPLQLRFGKSEEPSLGVKREDLLEGAQYRFRELLWAQSRLLKG